MNRTRPFVNRLVKQRQLELFDIYHDHNLKEVKPFTTKFMEHQQTITLNNSKGERLKEERQIEIERENKFLMNKISQLITKKGNYSIEKTKTIRSKACKSLNQIARKKHLESIQLQNKQILTRLSSKRATLDTLKLKKDWQNSRNLIRRIENYQTNLLYFNYKQSGGKSKKHERTNAERLQNINISQFRTINGVKMLIKITFDDGFLNIVGDLCNHEFLKIIKIPKDDALTLIQSQCEGKISNLMEIISYNRSSSTLYLKNQHLQEETLNPQVAKTTFRNTNSKLKSFTHRIIKSDFAHTVSSTNKSDISHPHQMVPQIIQTQVQHNDKQQNSFELNKEEKYYDQQFEPAQRIHSNGQLEIIIHNEKQKLSEEEHGGQVDKENLIKVEEQMYNEDFQQCYEINNDANNQIA